MSDDKDFVIKDKRAFSQEGSGKDGSENGSPDPTPADEEGPTGAPESKTAAEDAQDAPPLPEINFSTFVMSLNASVLVNLGVIDDPATGQRVKNLPLSKQTIDILGMLEEKTKGNLSEDEAQMLKSMLYELRMLYVREKG